MGPQGGRGCRLAGRQAAAGKLRGEGLLQNLELAPPEEEAPRTGLARVEGARGAQIRKNPKACLLSIWDLFGQL